MNYDCIVIHIVWFRLNDTHTEPKGDFQGKIPLCMDIYFSVANMSPISFLNPLFYSNRFRFPFVCSFLFFMIIFCVFVFLILYWHLCVSWYGCYLKNNCECNFCFVLFYFPVQSTEEFNVIGWFWEISEMFMVFIFTWIWSKLKTILALGNC